MGEKARIRTALAILGFTGGLVVWSVIDRDWSMPPELWGIAMAAAAYFFSTGDDDSRWKKKRHD